MTIELVEAVARALCSGRGEDADKCALICSMCATDAQRAIAVIAPAIRAQALEEAARVAEGCVKQECCGNPVGGYPSPPECCGNPDVTPMFPNEIAAAIRALIPSEEKKP